MYIITHTHPTIGTVFSASTYDTIEAAQPDCDAHNKFTPYKFEIKPMSKLSIVPKNKTQKLREALLDGKKIAWDNIRQEAGQMASIAARIKDFENEGMEIQHNPHYTYLNESGETIHCTQYSMTDEAIVQYKLKQSFELVNTGREQLSNTQNIAA